MLELLSRVRGGGGGGRVGFVGGVGGGLLSVVVVLRSERKRERKTAASVSRVLVGMRRAGVGVEVGVGSVGWEGTSSSGRRKGRSVVSIDEILRWTWRRRSS